MKEYKEVKKIEMNDFEIEKLPPLDYRIPKWDLNELQERNCPICNNPDSTSKYIRPDSLTVKYCNNCNTFFVSPAPSLKQLSIFYSNYDEETRPMLRISADELVLEYQDINSITDFRIKELSNHIKIPNSKVLDVGFGRAYLLYSLMKLGAIPYGIELDDKAINYANALGIPNIYKGTIEDMCNDTLFDIIIFDQLIEHPLNPMSLLRKASTILEDNGLIMILMPNGEVIKNEGNPITLRVDLEHMQYLTHKSCEFIAKEVKIQIVHYETLGFPNLKGIDKPLKPKSRIKKRIKKFIKLVPTALILYNILVKFSRKLFSTEIEKQKGNYVVFCIMQKICDQE